MLSECERLVKYLIQSEAPRAMVGDACVSRLYVDLSAIDSESSDCESSDFEHIYRESGVERSDDTDAILRARWIIASLNTDGFVDWEVYETEAEYREAWARCEAEFEGMDWDSI